MLAKRGCKVRVFVQPVPTTPTPTSPVNSTAPTPTVANASTQMPVVKSTATSIPVMVYNLATGKFSNVPHPTARPQNEGHPSLQSSKIPLLQDIPNAPVRVLLSLAQGQPLRICLKQGKIGQFPLHLPPL